MATTGFLKVSWLLLYCVMSSTRINNSCQQNGLLRFKEIIDSNRIGGHRLADMNMIVFEKDVFTNLQCLDLCLRIKVCASIDIKKQNTQRSCRVNRANPKYFIIENDDWTHKFEFKGVRGGKFRSNMCYSVHFFCKGNAALNQNLAVATRFHFERHLLIFNADKC